MTSDGGVPKYWIINNSVLLRLRTKFTYTIPIAYIHYIAVIVIKLII
jgi:hypothetical protein